MLIVIDDDADSVTLIKSALEECPPFHTMLVGNGGPAGLAVLQQYAAAACSGEERHTLVLLDIRMPVIDGFAVLDRIRNDERIKHVPVVMFSSCNDPATVSLAYEGGANGYLVKTASFREFQESLYAT
ncbi:MAG: response regulator, partial [Acidobacteria bacterium]|nr:response regulator [Acidobacteriota bacterium]